MSGTSKQTWWNPSPFDSRNRADASRGVRRRDQLDLDFTYRQKADYHVVVFHVHHGIDLKT